MVDRVLEAQHAEVALTDAVEEAAGDLMRRVEGMRLPVTAIVPRDAGDQSIDAAMEAGMSAVGRAMTAGESWAPKGSRSPR